MCRSATEHFDCAVAEVPRARHYLRDRMSAWRVPPDDAAALVNEELQLVGGELAANAVRFCREGFTVHLEAHHDHVVLAVEDDGPPTPGLTVSPAVPEATAESGRGLVIVGAVSTDWGVKTATVSGSGERGTRVWARLDFPEPSDHFTATCRLIASHLPL